MNLAANRHILPLPIGTGAAAPAPACPVLQLQSLQHGLLGSSSHWPLLGQSSLCQCCCDQMCPCSRNTCVGSSPGCKADGKAHGPGCPQALHDPAHPSPALPAQTIIQLQSSLQTHRNYISSFVFTSSGSLKHPHSCLRITKPCLCRAGPLRSLHGSWLQMCLLIHHIQPPFSLLCWECCFAPQRRTHPLWLD